MRYTTCPERGAGGSVGIDGIKNVSDIGMPDMAGNQVVAHLSRCPETAHLPVITLTTDGRPLAPPVRRKVPLFAFASRGRLLRWRVGGGHSLVVDRMQFLLHARCLGAFREPGVEVRNLAQVLLV